MTLTLIGNDIPFIKTVLMLAVLAGLIGSVFFAVQGASPTTVALANAADTPVAFQVQADGYTYLPTF